MISIYKKTSDVISKCNEMYGDKYTLDISDDIVDTNLKILCRCNNHNTTKYVNLRHFLAGDTCGCKMCSQERNRALKREDYINKFIEKWGDNYSFEKLNYIDGKHEGTITCNIHGDFVLNQIRYAFDDIPCPICRGIKKKEERNSNFLDRLKNKYGEKYIWITKEFEDYYKDYVEFICPKHGSVKQLLATLLNKDSNRIVACPICNKEKQNIDNSYTLEEAINKAKSQDCCEYYDFSNIIEWKGVKNSYRFRCKKHNCDFNQTFDSLFSSKGNGCPVCKSEYMSLQQRKSTEQFIEDAKNIHGKKYNYSKVQYVNKNTNVCIICPKHGEFWQKPDYHLQGNGCKKCNNSKLETVIRTSLETNNINYVIEKSVKDLTGKMMNDKPQRVDFFIPKYNLCIECQGIQHFKPIKFSSKMTDEQIYNNYIKLVHLDKFKYEALSSCGIDVIYFTKESFIKYDVEKWYSDKNVYYDVDSVLDHIKLLNHE